MTQWDSVQVCVDLEPMREPVPLGFLRRQSARSGEIFSFEYERSWLERDEVFTFDPDLSLVAGAQYPSPERTTFGIFLDSSPDRWGRVLMQRRENSRARQEGRKPRALTEWDFLLGVHDETRLGALRFRPAPGQPFIDSDAIHAAPPIASLRDLQAASLWFEHHLDEESHPDYERWLSQLFAPGTSLRRLHRHGGVSGVRPDSGRGGGRPEAGTVRGRRLAPRGRVAPYSERRTGVDGACLPSLRRLAPAEPANSRRGRIDAARKTSTLDTRRGVPYSLHVKHA